MKDRYFSISKASEGFYKEKGSKFIAWAFPARDEEEVKAHLEALRSKYYDARHHCYAYAFGPEQEPYRANDDGEPSNSAGAPILGQIRSHELSDVLVVVIRYFGGTKLGVGGLIHAYKTAAHEALAQAKRKEVVLCKEVWIKHGYEQMNWVMRLISQWNLTLIEQDLTDTCITKVKVPLGDSEALKKQLEKTHTITYEYLD